MKDNRQSPERKRFHTPAGLQAIRCDYDGLKMAEIKDGHLVLRVKHHGETHVKIVALRELGVVLETRSA